MSGLGYSVKNSLCGMAQRAAVVVALKIVHSGWRGPLWRRLGGVRTKGSIMKNGRFFIPREQIFPFFNPGEMNSQEGLYLCWETGPTIARRVLPPQLTLLDPEHPLATVYVVNIREPTFTSWYMEAGLMLLCR